MKVILTTAIKKLGKIGDTVSVKPGYARNFLFPNNMALRESKRNKDHYEKIKDEMIRNEEIKLNEAKKLLEELKKIKISFNREADEKDQLYGSISKKEIIDYLLDNNLKVRSDDLLIKNQIKSIGKHTIEINPYEDIIEELTIEVLKN
ncbi:50S ribosomal protein L9 [Pelagibacteraceae bacterium]|nr:50S ribosomal protein L9 [Pelagibacteraceae bacterium]|tara:strand:+ start:55 stop:498 length:444 start_codon:yes stop_codon:yes gene_type:complete